MKKIKPIIKIISFSLILSMLLYVLSYMAKPSDLSKPNGHNLGQIKGFYSEKENTLDLVYLGGSAVFEYYAPLKTWEDYGLVSYDFSAGMIQAELYIMMIKEILKSQSPELIVIDARAFQYRDADNIDAIPPEEVSYRYTLTGVPLSVNKIVFIDQNVGTHINDKKLSYYFDLLKYHDNIVNFNSTNIKMMLGTYKDPYNGFYFVPKVEKIKQYDFKTDKKKAVSNDTEAILIDLLNYMDSTGIDYLFTVSPYAEKKEHKMTFNYVQEIIEKRGYRFIDCNEYTEQMNLVYSTDFSDYSHVNIFGAEKYTDFLNQYILDNYSIPNRKDDANYSFMNTYLSDWKNDVKKNKAEITKLIEGKKDE